MTTVLLLLLAINLLPHTSADELSRRAKLGAGAFALIVGAGVAALSYAILTRGFETISDYYVAQSKPSAGRANVVNVILVDFRAMTHWARSSSSP